MTVGAYSEITILKRNVEMQQEQINHLQKRVSEIIDYRKDPAYLVESICRLTEEGINSFAQEAVRKKIATQLEHALHVAQIEDFNGS